MPCQRARIKITKESVQIRSQTFLEYSVAVMPSYGYCLYVHQSLIDNQFLYLTI
jgi:hypothetical protein